MTEQHYIRHARRMSAELKDSLFLEERDMIIADLYFTKHRTQQQIAEELVIAQATVSNAIKRIRHEYSMKRMNKLQSYLNVELAKLDAVEREAWQAWEKSIGVTTKKVKKKTSDGYSEDIEQTETTPGDPRFLTQVQAAIDRRIRLLGLDAPQEVILNTMEGRLTKLIKEGMVTFDVLVQEIGLEQARRYFNLADVDVPEIIEGTSYIVNEDLSEMMDEEEYYLAESA